MVIVFQLIFQRSVLFSISCILRSPMILYLIVIEAMIGWIGRPWLGVEASEGVLWLRLGRKVQPDCFTKLLFRMVSFRVTGSHLLFNIGLLTAKLLSHAGVHV